MNRFSVFIATTLDGFIARSDGRIDFLDVAEHEGEDYGYARFFDSIDTLVIGRNTYETALSFASWPYAGKRVVVMTTQRRAARHDEVFFSGTATDLAATLGERRRVYVDGGSVIRQFLAEKILTDVTLSILPIMIGSGVRLFRRSRERRETRARAFAVVRQRARAARVRAARLNLVLGLADER